MIDPWDVKSVRQSNQYISCMKLSGIPLLPPVLSKECRKEMQYYKILAKEVEKRISILKPLVGSDDCDSLNDRTYTSDMPDYESVYELPPDNIDVGFNINKDKTTAIPTPDKSCKLNKPQVETDPIVINEYKSIISSVVVKTSEKSEHDNSLVIDLSLSINDKGKKLLHSIKNTPQNTSRVELPERDYSPNINDKDILTDVEIFRKDVRNKGKWRDNNKDILHSSVDYSCISPEGPSSLTSKSFTGSLDDIYKENAKDSEIVPKLIRQRSYTLLQPSPQLQAHLEMESMNTGKALSSISMSESLSNIHSPNKKRRSWDLESAKQKWSTMALELKEAAVSKKFKTAAKFAASNKKSASVKSVPKKSPPKESTTVLDLKQRRGSLNSKILPKTDSIVSKQKNMVTIRNSPSSKTISKDFVISTPIPIKQRPISPNRDSPSKPPAEEPGTRVRELYEKIQQQQIIQMANLVEKQKREQLLLQKVFEEQNSMLFKQLKIICPKTTVEVKPAWGDNTVSEGPVNLSQLFNDKTTLKNAGKSRPASPDVDDTTSYIKQCDNVLKKSRNITGNIKKQIQVQQKSNSLNERKAKSPPSPPSTLEGTKTRTHSPVNMFTPRKLVYDSGATDHDFEPILTDRTNDTLADFNNLSFPSDNDDYQTCFYSHEKDQTPKHISPPKHVSPNQIKTLQKKLQPATTDAAIRSLETSIHDTMNALCKNAHTSKVSAIQGRYTSKEREASTKIVAYAKGFLVRRLMRTERVQATVQTIRDALLCALQLHQDREGIRGADVDLHRRLIQQITAACYNLHETFVSSTPAERCSLIAADRERRRAVAARPPSVGRTSYHQVEH